MAQVTTVSFDEKTSDLITVLKVRYGASSKAEIFRKAIALLALVADAERDGAKLVIKGKDYEKQILVT